MGIHQCVFHFLIWIFICFDPLKALSITRATELYKELFMRGEFNRDNETNSQSAWVCGRGGGRLAPTGFSPEPLASRVAPLTWSKPLNFSGTFLSYRQKRVLGSLALMLAFKWVFINVWMSMLFGSECFFLFLEQSGLGMDEVGLVCVVTDLPCLSSLNVSFSQRVMQTETTLWFSCGQI